MIKKNILGLCTFLLLVPTIQYSSIEIDRKGVWQPLFDMSLSNWEVFIGVPVPGVNVAGYPDANREKQVPLGLNNDPLRVFTMEEENDQPILHVSGQILGGLTTKREYQNYHLKFKFKWGKQKYAPKLNAKRDNGILYHATGPHGKFWNVWMRSHEMQIQETDMGDYFALAGTVMNIKSKKVDTLNQFIYTRDGELRKFISGQPGFVTRCRRGSDHEIAYGEWNELELICFEDKSLHIVNGHVVMALQDSRIHVAEGDEPSIQRGRIQLQSEYAEAYYKDMQIQSIKSLDKQYAKYF